LNNATHSRCSVWGAVTLTTASFSIAVDIVILEIGREAEAAGVIVFTGIIVFPPEPQLCI